MSEKVEVSLPSWVAGYEESLKTSSFVTDEDMMLVAVEASAKNVEHGTGGPFGAAIYERDKATGKSRLVALGSNSVVPLNNSTLHGEMVAIQFAEKRLGTFSLKATDKHEYILCTSCEPCAMCLGGTLWSGVSELICAGTKEDAEAIG
jgi:tRNA(Arg) A34 adenosine deaminase TadA